MKVYVNPKDLELDFRRSLIDEVENLKRQYQILTGELQNLMDMESESSGHIKIGSKVLVRLKDDSREEGRVVGNRKDLYQVIRNGHNVYTNIPREYLQNLSIGFIGNIERQKWVTQKRIESLNKILIESELDSIITEEKHNIVEVVKIVNSYPCDIIHYVLARNIRSGKLKIPKGYVKEIGYYEIEVMNGEVKGIRSSSKSAFDKASE